MSDTVSSALRMPSPQVVYVQVLPVGNDQALYLSTSATWSGVRLGRTPNSSDATPDTCGAAMLVPFWGAYVLVPGVVAPLFKVEVTATPGALIATTLPKLL